MFLEPTTHKLRRRIALIGAVLIISPVLVVVLAGYLVFQRVEHLAHSTDLSPLVLNQKPGARMAVWHANQEISAEETVYERLSDQADILPDWALWLLLGVSVAATGLSVRIWLQFSRNLIYRESEPVVAIPESPRALQHIDASNAWVGEMLDAFDQITHAISTNADPELRALIQRCRQSARTAQSELRQTHSELQPEENAAALLRLASNIDKPSARALPFHQPLSHPDPNAPPRRKPNPSTSLTRP